MKPSGPGAIIRSRGRRVTGRAQAADHAPHGLGRVGVQFGVGHPGLLEIEHVEEVVAEDRAERLRSAESGRAAPAERSSPTTAATRSGCSSAEPHTTGAPQSWPTNTALSAPTSSSRPTRSADRSAML